jgi:hypothetical protein
MARKRKMFHVNLRLACVPAAMTHLTNVLWLLSPNHAESSITAYDSASTCIINVNHTRIRHFVFNIWGKLLISVEFRSKLDNIRIAVLKCNVKKLVNFVTGFIGNYFLDKLMWPPFSQFMLLWSHSQLNCRYFSNSLYPLLIAARKRYKLQTVLLTFSTWYVLRLMLKVTERNHDLDLGETNIIWHFSRINLGKCH